MSTGIYTRTEEDRKHRREMMKGNQFAKGNKPNKTSFKKGQVSLNKGRHFSEEIKEKISKAMKGHIAWDRGKLRPEFGEAEKGENNPNWKGGVKESNRRKESKRRSLGYIPMNSYKSYEEGYVFHHFDEFGYGVYMSKEDHTSIYHNVFTGKNMDTINALAMNYL